MAASADTVLTCATGIRIVDATGIDSGGALFTWWIICVRIVCIIGKTLWRQFGFANADFTGFAGIETINHRCASGTLLFIEHICKGADAYIVFIFGADPYIGRLTIFSQLGELREGTTAKTVAAIGRKWNANVCALIRLDLGAEHFVVGG